jgi:outer membrane protein OmpA-like peptidoglycan-associated protein
LWSRSARRGRLAGWVVGPGGVVGVRTSGDAGASFSPPAVAAEGGDRFTTVGLAVAAQPVDSPVARFDWSVPDRYTDTDADGLLDPANDTGDPAIDGLTVDKIDIRVALDGCSSLPSPGPSRAITQWSWSVDGTALPSTTCRASFDGRDDVPATVRLEVTDDTGARSASTVEVTPRDLLVVSVGDSVASGEGNPHAPSTATLPPGDEVWQDGPCHRSAWSGPARAARRLEEADPRTSVTFVQLSCSGAAMLDVPPQAGAAPAPGAPDDPATGGLLDEYEGVEPAGAAARPSQLSQLAELKGSRPVDALLVSIGANDVKFSDVVIECLTTSATDLGPCHTSGTRDRLAARLATLPARYDALASALDALGVAPADTYLTEYFDAGSDDLGLPGLRCILDAPTVGLLLGSNPVTGGGAFSRWAQAALGSGLVTDDEAAWARDYVTAEINAGVRAATVAHGWRYVGGIAARFARHGYCASDPWVVRLGQSGSAQGDPNGAFHPNRAGHQAYADALARPLRAATSLPAPVPATAGPLAAGDITVLTGGGVDLVASVLVDTGGAPALHGSKVLDRVASAATGSTGNLVTGTVSVAAERAAAAGAWAQLDYDGTVRATGRAGPISVRRNAAVERVRVVQAPETASLLVTGRDTVVLARVDAAIGAPYLADVTTEVFASGGPGGDRDILTTTQQVRLVPGRNDLLLPDGATFRPEQGEAVGARVTVSDPAGAEPADEVDNARSAADDVSPPVAVDSRSVRVVVVPTDVAGAAPLSCQGLGRFAQRMTDFLAAAAPVQQGGADVALSCTATGEAAVPQDERGVLRALGALDLAARQTAADIVVGVVPDGWLSVAAGGAVGAAASGMRAVVVESSAPSETLVHEFAHTLGVGHTAGRVPAPGARVASRTVVDGTDWMHFATVPRPWTGAATWDTLVERIGGPDGAPTLPDPTSGGVWVRGIVSRNADGTWTTSPARWVPGGPTGPTGPDLSDELELERMVVQQTDADGAVVTTAPVGLGSVDGLAGAAAGSLEGVLGFATHVVVAPTATAIRLVLDGEVVETRPVSAAPTVTLDTPAAGSTLHRGDAMTVRWTASDPDGDPLSADVLVSDDAGATWQPLGRAAAGDSSVTVPVPANLAGTSVQIRVVVSDGVRAAVAESGLLTVQGGVTLLPERVLFTRYLEPNGFSHHRIFTMLADGSDVTEVGLPTVNGTVEDPDCLNQNRSYCTTQGRPSYADPVWSPDGRRIAFSSTLRSATVGSTGDDWVEEHLYVSDPDGAGLVRISAGTHGDETVTPLSNRCATWSPDGSRLAWLGYDRYGSPRRPTALWVADADGTDRTRILTSADLVAAPRPADWPAPELGAVVSPSLGTAEVDYSFGGYGSCPQWSPDGSSLAMTATYFYSYLDGATTKQFYDQSAVLLVAPDGSSPRFVSPLKAPMVREGCCIYSPDRFRSVAWLGDKLVVNRESKNASLTQPYAVAAWSLDPVTGALSRLSPDRPFNEAPVSLKEAPDGSLFGVVTTGTSCTPVLPPGVGDACYPDQHLGVIDPGTSSIGAVPLPAQASVASPDWVAPSTSEGTAQVVVPPAVPSGAADAGGPYVALAGGPVDLDAGSSTALSGPGGAAAAVDWDLDADGEFDDATGVRPTVSFAAVGTVPVRVRVLPPSGSTVLSAPVDVVVADRAPEADVAAPGADVVADAIPAAADVAASVPAGADSDVVLATVGDVPGTAFDVVSVSDPARLGVLNPPGSIGGDPRTGPDGVLRVRPSAALRGVVTLGVRVAGSAGPVATVTLSVAGNTPPRAVADLLIASVGQPVLVPASSLLGNDTDADSDALRIVSVSWLDGSGVAALDTEGRVVVRAGQVGTAQVGYVVADTHGATDTGLVGITVLGPPGVPSGPVVEPGAGSVRVTWGAPAADGGSPVTGFVVGYRLAGAEGAWSEQATTASAATLTGLIDGSTYEVRVAAHNDQGQGPWSPAMTATPASAPGQPEGLVLAPRSGGLDARWVVPSRQGGSPVTDYLVEYAVVGGAWARWPTGGTGTAVSITGLVPGAAYDVRVAAVNGVGPGPWSASVRASVPTTTSTAPPAVRKLPKVVRTLTAARVLSAAGSPAAALRTTTPLTCVTRGGRVLFLDQAGRCQLQVVRAGVVVRRLGALVRRDGPRPTDPVRAQRTVRSRFRGDSPQLTAASRAALTVQLPRLREAGAVAVYGYASSSRPGVSTAFAERLSSARARAVASYLRQRGVTVVAVRGYGARHPVPGGPSANRRAVTGWTP